ncbi:hypothetical protein [Agromyces luteolus]|uniref:Uncharacterized protein n=1 Tax=Agromyces luteolus TaxID=88373 RepID=A0A7C9HR38_9MICO|nr:hypothetical protein [Agromyces luteolus]MUN07389.1 hypothetical protein [Agromyces luteolus]
MDSAPPATLRPGFVDALPTRVVPASLGTMGHLVDARAPSGTVGVDDAALGAPVQRATAVDLPLRPRPSGAPAPSGGRTGRAVAVQRAGEPEPVVGQATDATGAADTAGASDSWSDSVPDDAAATTAPDPAPPDHAGHDHAAPDRIEPDRAAHDQAAPDTAQARVQRTPHGPGPAAPTLGADPRSGSTASRPGGIGGVASDSEAGRAPATGPLGAGPVPGGLPVQRTSAPADELADSHGPAGPEPLAPRRGPSGREVPTIAARTVDPPIDRPAAGEGVPTAPFPAPPAPSAARRPGLGAPLAPAAVQRSPESDGADRSPGAEASRPSSEHPIDDATSPDPSPAAGAVAGEPETESAWAASDEVVVTGLPLLGDRGPGTGMSAPGPGPIASGWADPGSGFPLAATDTGIEHGTDPTSSARSGDREGDGNGVEATNATPTTSASLEASATPVAARGLVGASAVVQRLGAGGDLPGPQAALPTVSLTPSRRIVPSVTGASAWAPAAGRAGGRVVVARVVAPEAGNDPPAGVGREGPDLAASVADLVDAASGRPIATGAPAAPSGFGSGASADPMPGGTPSGPGPREAASVLTAPASATVQRSVAAAGTPASATSPPRGPLAVQRFGLPSIPSMPGAGDLPDLSSLRRRVPDLGEAAGEARSRVEAAASGAADRARDAASSTASDLRERAEQAADSARGASAAAVDDAAAAAGAALGGGTAGAGEVEQLVRRIYGPLVRRIKAELLLDRERRGIRIDGI